LTLYALDANTIIHAFQGKGGVASRIASVPPSRIAIPSVVLFEVERGVLRSNNATLRRQQLHDLVVACRLLPFEERAASIGARILADLEDQGLKIGPRDTLIAATCVAHSATLVTHNTREFSRVPGLKIEDWFSL
jgi:tRNA(fMet)-specific endonuclease VapC